MKVSKQLKRKLQTTLTSGSIKDIIKVLNKSDEVSTNTISYVMVANLIELMLSNEFTRSNIGNIVIVDHIDTVINGVANMFGAPYQLVIKYVLATELAIHNLPIHVKKNYENYVPNETIDVVFGKNMLEVAYNDFRLYTYETSDDLNEQFSGEFLSYFNLIERIFLKINVAYQGKRLRSTYLNAKNIHPSWLVHEEDIVGWLETLIAMGVDQVIDDLMDILSKSNV